MHPDHAIERARINITFDQPLPSKAVSRLGGEIDTRRRNLGFANKVERKGTQFSLGPDGGVVSATSGPITGWTLQKFQSGTDKVIEALTVETQAASFETLQYTRWANFRASFRAVAEQTLDEVGSLVDFSTVSLEYVDRFVFFGEADSAIPTGIVPMASNVIEGPALDGTELWHIHRGWFEHSEVGQILINQNVDCQDGALPGGVPARSVQILTKIEKRNAAQLVDSSVFDRHMEIMHKRSKEIFASVISAEALGMIGAFGGDAS